MAYQISEECKGCGACAKKCPEHAIDGKVKVRFDIDPFLCKDCGDCFRSCPRAAILDPQGNRPPKKGKKQQIVKAHIDPAMCVACQTCLLNCPEGAIHLVKKSMFNTYCLVDLEACVGCGSCTEQCITGAVSLTEPSPSP